MHSRSRRAGKSWNAVRMHVTMRLVRARATQLASAYAPCVCCGVAASNEKLQCRAHSTESRSHDHRKRVVLRFPGHTAAQPQNVHCNNSSNVVSKGAPSRKPVAKWCGCSCERSCHLKVAVAVASAHVNASVVFLTHQIRLQVWARAAIAAWSPLSRPQN